MNIDIHQKSLISHGLFALTLLFSAQASHAAVPSFNCNNATTQVEKTICSSNTLSQQDQNIAQLYQQILKKNPAIVSQAFFVASQQTWNNTRQECVRSTDINQCLTEKLKQRHQQLIDLLNAKPNQQINMAIAMIPENPRLAAQQLRQYPDHLIASAWLVYMGYHAKNSGVGEAEKTRLENQLIHSIIQNDQMTSDVLELAKHKNANGVFYLLRAVYDQGDDIDSYIGGCPQYFIFQQHGQLAYQAFDAQYGSSRDARTPYCIPNNDLYALPAWINLKDALSHPMQVAYNKTGTMRYASFAHFAVESLKASVSPIQYADTQYIALKAKNIIRITNWQNPSSWTKQERHATVALIKPAEEATQQWLIKNRKLSSEQASKAAIGIVANYLHLWTIWLESPDE